MLIIRFPPLGKKLQVEEKFPWPLKEGCPSGWPSSQPCVLKCAPSSLYSAVSTVLNADTCVPTSTYCVKDE